MWESHRRNRSCLPEIATAPSGPRNDKSGAITVLSSTCAGCRCGAGTGCPLPCNGRECLQCQRRFTTYETVESLPIVVVKKDGSRQSFDRNKILNGMLRACEKRPVSLAALETAALDIEQILQNSLEREVSTGQIGELVMERLKPLDEVAYVRFASVYRQFKDINSFMRELNKILEEK